MTLFRGKLREKYHELIEDLRRDLHSLGNDEFTKELYDYFETIIPKFITSYHDTEWFVGSFDMDTFPLEFVEEVIQVLSKWDDTIQDEQLRIFRERKEKEEDQTSSSNREEPLRSEHYKVRHTLRHLKDFKLYLKGNHIKLSIDPKVLITGKAGKGKSHLLGDTVMTRLEENKPSIFILGQQLGGSK